MDPASVINIYLASISFVYLWAFSSLYFQIPGLYGDNGLLPIRPKLICEFKNQSQCAFSGSQPSILHYFVDSWKVSPSSAMELACVLGIIASALSAICQRFRDCTVYAVLWYLYFSCFQVGQTFLWFQWDTLLLETGFLTILLAPCRIYRRIMIGKGSEHWLPWDNVNLFLIRWLAFRLLFASGVVKLSSDCQTWWGLTALHYHFESQCIPTWPAWYAHVLSPDWFKKLSVVATYMIEIFIPAAFFMCPVRKLRQVAFWSQVFLMVNIMITGNYNFFNAITIAVCIPMLIKMDGHSRFGSHKLRAVIGHRLYNASKNILMLIGLGYMAHWTIEFFTVRFDTKKLAIESKVAFTREEYDDMLSWSSSRLLVLGSIAFVAEIGAALIRCITDIRASGFIGSIKRLSVLFHCLIICSLAATMFAISLVPVSWLHRDAYGKLWPGLVKLHQQSDKYQLTHSYGLFRHMTGVGGRPEIVIQGSVGPNGPWKEYEFLYKPGALDRRPPIIIPHQARLDWQMWFAALDTYQRNPWFYCLMYRLLTQEKDVVKLMDVKQLPFGGKKPKYVRAELYWYHYTTNIPGDKNYHAQNWWWREYKREYFPQINLEDSDWAIEYLKHTGCILENIPRTRRTRINAVLSFLRDFADLFEVAEYFIWSLTAVVLISILIRKILGYTMINSDKNLAFWRIISIQL